MGASVAACVCASPGRSVTKPHEVRLAATEILNVAGMSGYHTSVILDDREYFFDSLGIMAAPPLSSHLAGQDLQVCAGRTTVVDIGRSACSGNALVQALHPHFERGSYDIFFKNCNTFSDVALYFLTRQRLTGCYNRIERMITATSPVSTGLLNRLFRAFLESKTGLPCEDDVYVTNPEAEDFSVDDLIASFEEYAWRHNQECTVAAKADHIDVATAPSVATTRAAAVSSDSDTDSSSDEESSTDGN
mmetsp:Transcript_45534/g.90217  ORF Transcript_45534/g.90217 Transcript_45534/m.90217 type:complete len:247 (-) Transcript_45534:30-770(-)